MADSVTVGVRVRPLNDRELANPDNTTLAWDIDDNEISRNLVNSNKPSHPFCYDAVFQQNSTNREVYDRLAAPVIDAALGGFNATVFAYGQTSSGKTHSMLGSPRDPGITPLAIRHVLTAAETSRSRNFLIRAVYVEIYNDRIRDLLNPTSADLTVREDKAGRVFVDAEEVLVESFEDAMSALNKGQNVRSVGGTNMNAQSSRSHTVFTLHIESKNVEGLDASFRCSSLNLVDLAGSERLKSTGAEGARKAEGAHINKSLVVLGTIINRLSAAGQDPSKIGHLPYRDSKLTRLLRPALGGNAKTAVLCAITPAAAHVEETLSSLKFAERAKKITTNATRNEVVDYRAKYKEASTEVAVLRQRYAAIQAELASVRASKEISSESGDGTTTISTTQDSPEVDDVDVDHTPASPTANTGQTDPSSPPASGSTDTTPHDADTAREIATSIELRAARDQVNVLKAHIDELEGQNEHLRARMRIKAGEFVSLKARAVELRSAARRAKHNERSLRNAMAAAFGKLEEARQQLDISRKKGAHVKIAEGYLEELSVKLHSFAKGSEAENGNASAGGEASESVSVESVSAVVVSVDTAGEDETVSAAGGSGGGGGGLSSARESMESARASVAGSEKPGSVTGTSVGEGEKITSVVNTPNSGGGDGGTESTSSGKQQAEKGRTGGPRLSATGSERLDGGTWTKRRPRPLPEDMVADIDDSETETIVTEALAVESGDEEFADEERSVEDAGERALSDVVGELRLSDVGECSTDVRMDDEEEGGTTTTTTTTGEGTNETRTETTAEGREGRDESTERRSTSGKSRKKGNRGWRALRSFYGHAERGVYDKVIGGHKVPTTGNLPN